MWMVSRVPSAAEMLRRLGRGGEVVGVTHDGYYPLQAHQPPPAARIVAVTAGACHSRRAGRV